MKLINQKLWSWMLILLLATVGLAAESKREYRKFTLKNGLKVVLVSDVKVEIASASMDVAIGSLANPTKRPGLAHFLEHMLFLATKKYPQLNSYSEYLKSHGGYSNAYTASDNTNYHFQVFPDVLPEALDRFAHFFIDPILDPKYISREVRAVHSEHQKNIPRDMWRLMQIEKTFLKAKHPASVFSTGNLETLGDTSPEEFQQFFADYYSPQRMALSIIAPLSLDRMEHLVREIFEAIPQRNNKQFHLAADVLEIKNALRLIQVVPVSDIRQLKLYFALPPQQDKISSKPYRLIGMTMGDEGEGSLLSLLKKKGLATALSSGVSEDNDFFNSCRITVELTQKGLQEYPIVLRLCFSYIEMLKQDKFPRHIWDEMKKMAQLRQLYSPKPEGARGAIELARNANKYGLDIAEKAEYIFTEPDPQGYRQIIEALRPDNMLVSLVARGMKTDRVEKWYGTKYSVVEETGELYRQLQKPELNPELYLPRPNPFVPEKVGIIPEQPILLLETPGITLWYAQDTEFARPKVAIYIDIMTPESYIDARSAALVTLYAALCKERLNEYAYPAMMAGLHYSLAATNKGIFLSVTGYSDSAFTLLEVVGKQLTNADFSAQMFIDIKEKMALTLKNFALAPATHISRELSRKLNIKQYYLPQELLPLLAGLTLDDLKQYVGNLYAQAHLRALYCGNLTASQAEQSSRQLYGALAARSFAREQAHQYQVLWLPANADSSYQQQLPSNNSCMRLEYQVGTSEDLPTCAAAWILGRAMQNAFFTEMRTRQMLGYAVFSGVYEREKVQNMAFIIQSASHDAHDLRQRADKFLEDWPQQLAKMPAEKFAAIRSSLIQDRQKKPKSIAEKAARFYHLAFEKEDFQRIYKEIQALNKVTQAQVLALSKKILSKDSRRRLAILLYANQHKFDKAAATIQDIAAFKQQAIFCK